jgi:hypothetical protein
LVGLWLHPVIWPATSPAQRRVRAAHLIFTVSAIGWLTGHAVLEMTRAVPRSLAHSWILTLSDGLTILGLALVLPLPRPRYGALLKLTIRRLAVPVLLGALVVAVANETDVSTASPVLRWTVVTCWWLALAAGVIQLIRVLTGFGAVRAPGPLRLRLGLWLATLGLALNGAIIFTAAVTVGSDKLLGAIAAAMILTLAVAATGTVRDLAELA